MTKKITKKTKMIGILNEVEGGAEILFEAGMGCVGCPMAMQESLEEGCLAHGMSEKQIEELVDKLNEIPK